MLMSKNSIILCLFFIILCGSKTYAEQYTLKGRVSDSLQDGLVAASVSLLDPKDSTLVVFNITNEQGLFNLSGIKSGNYLLQVALMGYYTHYQEVNVAEQTGKELGTIVLANNELGNTLDEVIVSGEKVPIRLRGDTLEYNAGSFKVKPDAVVEDLLKKMPGVEVDRNGNIKSMGKNVRKILVDGKEFFGDDPKVATKNLPADAVDKVQAFEKKSDASLFSGIDDGEREQTLNLVLKEGKKSGYFGEAKAGAGAQEQYETSLKAFKFRQKSQLAAMGMLNNINKFGFSLEDYFNFNGGLKSLAGNGGEIRLDADEMPVDVGQPITGKVQSGALALNYTMEPDPNRRLSVNYMGNGMRKLLDQYTRTQNFIPNGQFATEQQEQQQQSSLANRASVKWRQKSDSAYLAMINVYGLWGNNHATEESFSENYNSALRENYLDNHINRKGTKTEAGGDISLTQKRKGNWPVQKAILQAGYKRQDNREQWDNKIVYESPAREVQDQQYRNYGGRNGYASATLSAVRSLGKGYFLEPSALGNLQAELSNRKQGPVATPELPTDSLSPAFSRIVFNLNYGLTLKYIQKKQRWHIALKRADLWLNPVLNKQSLSQKHYAYFMPALFWETEPKMGKRISLSYNSSATAPSAAQMLPVTDYSNPLMLTKGNAALQPEYNHTLNASYMAFDQFSMSTFSASFRGNYTKNNIAYGRTVRADLSQQLQLMNTPYELSAQLSLDYSRPVKLLGLNISAGIDESWSQGQSPVNGIQNTNTSISHTLNLSFSNANSDVWDLRWGGSVNISDSRYSISSEMNNRYYNYSGFAQLAYRPVAQWNFNLSGDITHYTARSFDQPITVPILSAEITRYLLRSQRGAISLRVFDLLDKNKSVQRISQLNYLMEQRSNTIGRYLMLSFSYKLNRAGTPGAIKMGR